MFFWGSGAKPPTISKRTLYYYPKKHVWLIKGGCLKLKTGVVIGHPVPCISYFDVLMDGLSKLKTFLNWQILLQLKSMKEPSH